MTGERNGIESVYRHHHEVERGEGFVVLGEERGSFLKRHIGTGKKVLDLGCRDGALTAYYASDNDVLGVDIDCVALARARKNLGIRTVSADLNGTWDEIPRRAFDIVVAAEFFEHLYYPAAVLGKIADTLVASGALLGSIPHAFSIQNRARLACGAKAGTPLQDPTHINHFGWREFKELLETRFIVDEMEPILSRKFAWLSGCGDIARAFGHTFLFAAHTQ